MKSNEKQEWIKPELTVLVRSKPEEAVLATCKTGFGIGTTGPTLTEGDCLAEGCGVCESTSTS